MGIIKLKKNNEEVAANADVALVEEQEIIQDSEEIMDNAKTFKDAAVLYEDESRTDENSRHYVLNNGTAKAILSAESVNYFDETAKKWEEIDNTLQETAEGFENKQGKIKAKISKAQHGKKVEVRKAEKVLAWDYLGKQSLETMQVAVEDLPATLLKVGNGVDERANKRNARAVYENIEKDADLEYCLYGNNVKENIIVKEKSADYRYLFALKTEGLKLRLSEDSESLELYSEKAKEDGRVETQIEFTIPSPYMYDANGVASDDVYYELEPQEDGRYAFVVVASEEWINSPERAFPVTIDPQIVASNSSLMSRQVQYRIVSSGSGSGSSVGNWTNTSGYSDIKVYNDGYYQYRTQLTIKRSLINLANNRIASVKLLLTPSSSFSGYLVANNKRKDYNSVNGYLEVDITTQFKNTAADFTINIEPSYNYYECINGYFSAYSNPPIVEIEYFTNENTRPTKKTFSLAGIAMGDVNLATGDIVTSFCDVKSEDSAGGLAVKHIYKKSSEEFLLGDNFRLNLHETLIKNSDGALDTNYIYTDENGDKHGFKDYYYYINTSGKKVYITAAKSNITVEADGTLKYNGYTVYGEYKSATGLKTLTKLEGFKYVSHLEQRSDELKQVDDKVESYKNALKDFVAVNKSDGEIAYKLSLYLSSASSFDSFVSYASTSSRILLTESEALAYRSLILQKEALGYQSTTLSQQRASLGYSKISMGKQIETMNNTEVSEEAYKNVSTQNTINDAIIDNLNDQIDLATAQDTNTGNIASNNSKQITAIGKQITMYNNKKTQYLNQMKAYYKVYYSALNEQKKLNQQLPINFLTDGKIFKGYNALGQLVAIYDMYDNYVLVDYESYYVNYSSGYRIARIYDNKNKVVLFNYTPNNKLSCIIDSRGRKTSYMYKTDGKLEKVIYDTGEEITFGYDGVNIDFVQEAKNKLQSNIEYVGGKPNRICHYSTVGQVSHGDSTEATVFMGNTQLSFVQNTNGTMNYVTIIQDEVKGRYYFNADNNVREYRLDENGVVTKAEQYEYVPYWNGSATQSNPRSVTIQAHKDSLYQKNLDQYTFVAGDTETTVLDQFNNAEKTTTSAIRIGAGGNTQTVIVDYTYDDDQNLLEEKKTVSYSNPAKTVVSYVKYQYNANQEVVRTESYVVGEEYTKGKTIEERVYGAQGNVIKSFSYNSLDTSSKVYTEREYDEQGKVLAEVDETGENKTALSYVAGTNIVHEQKLPNGSKFAYGFAGDDTVTAITHSTEEGEENSTQTLYTYGKQTMLRSGNNQVEYSYEYTGYKESKVRLHLNGVQDYLVSESTISYDSSCFVQYAETKATNAKGEQEIVRMDGRGNVLSQKYSNGMELQYTYDGKDRLTLVTEKQNANAIRSFGYSYDTADSVTQYVESENGVTVFQETYTYDAYGKLVMTTQTTGMSYTYAYKDNASRDLESVTVNGVNGINGVTVKPQADMLSRNKGKEVFVGVAKIAEENIVYRKVGDHATNMPASIYFGATVNGKYVMNEHMKYAYDEMGNIAKVYENGDMVARYGYDALNRLVREDNKEFGKTWLYVYDNNGNILAKKETAYTLKADVEECVFTKNGYSYEGDKLLAYNNESFEYDEIGNPTTYRGKSAMWSLGRRLTAYDGHTFTYDAQGRRLAKDSISYIYDSEDRIVKQSNGLEFFYDYTGVVGMKYDGETYLYRKDVQGNIVALLDSSGKVVVKYVYDGWGNHGIAALNLVDGKEKFCDVEDTKAVFVDVYLKYKTLANLNPFRYRGYYYDTETELYFLNTRYYDPGIGRFITIDDISYIDAETINGLNLYAYCANNPVKNVDPNGNAWWHWVLGIAVVAGLVVGTILTAGGLGAGLMAIGCAANGMAMAGASLATTVFAFATVGAGTVLAASGIVAGLGAIETWSTGGSFVDGLNTISDYGGEALAATIGGGFFGAYGGLSSWLEQRPDIKATHSWTKEYRDYWAQQGLKKAPIGSDGKSKVLHHPYGRFGRGFYIYQEMTYTEHKNFHAIYGYGRNGGFYKTIPYTNFWGIFRILIGG